VRYAAGVQTRTRNALGLLAVGAVTALGLGALARRGRPLQGGGTLDAIPIGALLVAVADLKALRLSPAGAPFLREGREIRGVGKVKDVCGFDPLDGLTEVAVSIPAAGDAGDFGLVATGVVDADALVTCASKVIEARGGSAAITQIGAFRAVRDASLSAGSGEIAVRAGGPVILGAGAYLQAMIDTAEGRASTIRSSVAHGMLGRLLGDAQIRATLVLTPDQRRALSEELEASGGAGDPSGSIRAVALGATLGPAVALHAVISCDTAPACGALAKHLDEVRLARSKDLALRGVGIGAVLERMTIVASAETVDARVEVPADEAALLVERALTLRGLRHPMPAEGQDGAKPASGAPRTPRSP